MSYVELKITLGWEAAQADSTDAELLSMVCVGKHFLRRR
jgi:hypothetical protein